MSNRRDRLVDAAAAWLLTSAALAGWWSTFAGSQWLVAGVGGAAVATTIVALHAFRGQLIWASVTVPLAYLVIGVGILGVDFSDGKPTAGTLSAVIKGSARCWQLLVGTHPPVEATGVVLLAPTLAGVVTAALATALALASSRPTWPLLPLLTLLAGVLVTGSHASASVGLFGGCYGLACLVWAVHRAGRMAPDGPTVPARWPIAVPMLVASALLAVPLGGAMLGAQHERLVLREQAAAYGVDVVATPLDSFRRYRKQPGDLPDNAWRQPLARVSGAESGTVLRIAVLTRYDGRRWVAANDVEPGSHEDRFQLFSADYLTTPAEAGSTPLRVEVAPSWNSQWVPLAGRLVGLNVAFPGAVPLDELRFNPVTSSALATRTLGDGDEYEFFTEPVPSRLPDDARPSPLLDNNNFVAAEFLDNWARAARHEGGSRLDAVERAAALMRERGRYSDGAFGWEVRFARGQDQARLDDFMNGARMVGNDEQYAAAMALLATRLRVPARVVVGARVPSDGVVKGNDVVAWVELRISDGSWRELPRSSYMSFRSPKQSDPPNDPVVAPEPEPEQQPTPAPQPSPAPDPQPDESADPQQRSTDGSWSWLLLLLPCAAGAVPGIKLARRARRRRTARVSLRYAGAWQELVDRARDLGLAVPSRRSRPAQAVALDDSNAAGLARAADDAIFAAGEPGPEQAEAYWGSMLDVRARLGARASWRRRLLAPFNLASLRRS